MELNVLLDLRVNNDQAWLEYLEVNIGIHLLIKFNCYYALSTNTHNLRLNLAIKLSLGLCRFTILDYQHFPVVLKRTKVVSKSENNFLLVSSQFVQMVDLDCVALLQVNKQIIKVVCWYDLQVNTVFFFISRLRQGITPIFCVSTVNRR